MSVAKAKSQAKNAVLIASTSSATSTQHDLNISFPRCSCCKTSWYDLHELGADAQKFAVSVGERKRHRERPSKHQLLPMPKCECTTRLALPPLPSVIHSTDCCDPRSVLTQIKTCSFPNLAICRSCLKRRIAASKEVTVHDYHQGHIPNGQRDVKFTVELCCVQCKRKFSVRFLEKLLENEEAATSKSIAVKNKKQGVKPDSNWQDAVEATINLVGWAKQGIRKERRKLRQRKIGLVDGNEQDLRQWNNLTGFTGGDGNCSSDECYSFSSDSSDDYDDDELLHHSKCPRRQELQPGELMAELLQKDPKFRQEKADEQYVKKILEEQESHDAKVDALNAQAIEDEIFAKQLVERENETKQKAEERARKDHEIAIKIQQKLNKEASTLESFKTKSKSPILDAWKKTLTVAERSERKKPTPISVDNDVPRRIHAIEEYSDEVTLICVRPADPSLGAASRNFQSHHLPINRNPKSARGEQSDERASSQGSDKLVDEIMAMGFSRASAQRSLQQANGNVQQAVDLLLSESAADPS